MDTCRTRSYQRKSIKKGSFSTAGNMEIARGKAAGLYIDRKLLRQVS